MKRYARHSSYGFEDLVENPYGDWIQYSEIEKLVEQNRKMLESLKTLVSIFDPDKQSMYNFARHHIQTAKEIISNVEGDNQ